MKPSERERERQYVCMYVCMCVCVCVFMCDDYKCQMNRNQKFTSPLNSSTHEATHLNAHFPRRYDIKEAAYATVDSVGSNNVVALSIKREYIRKCFFSFLLIMLFPLHSILPPTHPSLTHTRTFSRSSPFSQPLFLVNEAIHTYMHTYI